MYFPWPSLLVFRACPAVCPQAGSPWVSEEVLKQHGILLLEPGAQGHGVVCSPFRLGLHTVVL
jgi:hypothetical protein